MPKKYRLTGEEMKNLSRPAGRQASRRLHGRFFLLLVVPIHGGHHPKVAVVVSKKTAQKAVDRNKIKRQARSALAKYPSSVQEPTALVLYAKPDAKGAAFAEIAEDIRALFSRL